MTYILSTRICYVKNGLMTLAATSDMVSAVKE